jgi:hypothetical protein
MATALLDAAALACVNAGAACLYMGAPRQLLSARSWPAAASVIAAAAFLLAGGWLMSFELAPATVVFAELAVAMAALIALPPLAALLRAR